VTGILRGRRAARRALAELEQLDDRGLALRVEAAYWRLGFRVRREPGDGLIVSGRGRTTAVRARRHADHDVVAAVAEVRERLGCDRALLVTPGPLAGGVRRSARAADVELLEGRELGHLVASALER
jgi:HJR/Mrr/RecB family endonuclease